MIIYDKRLISLIYIGLSNINTKSKDKGYKPSSAKEEIERAYITWEGIE